MKFLVRALKDQIRWIIFIPYFVIRNHRQIFSGEKCYYFCGTPLYGNLGDQAIAVATEQLLEEWRQPYVEIPLGFIEKHTWFFKIFIRRNPILIIGGGFLGDLWEWGNGMINAVTYWFRRNDILILPQTIYYSHTPNGQRALEKTIKRFYNCRNLKVCAREERSYHLGAKLWGKDKMFLLPDLVLFLKLNLDRADSRRRKNIIFAKRDDIESLVNSSEMQELEQKIKEIYPAEGFLYSDNLVMEQIRSDRRKKRVTDRLREISDCRLMVTDRLHGMLFAYLTQTPCLVLKNGNGKVEGVYAWLRHTDSIKLLDKREELLPFLIKMKEQESGNRKTADLSDEKNRLKQLVLGMQARPCIWNRFEGKRMQKDETADKLYRTSNEL